MIDSPTNHPAADILRSYFSEMNAWERECAAHYKSLDWERGIDKAALDLARASQRKRLEQIFERYCEIGKQAERLQDLGSYNPDQPEHDDEEITSLTEKAGKVIIETRQRRFRGWEFRYEVVQVDGNWRLRDNRKFRSQGKPAWKRHML